MSIIQSTQFQQMCVTFIRSSLTINSPRHTKFSSTVSSFDRYCLTLLKLESAEVHHVLSRLTSTWTSDYHPVRHYQRFHSMVFMFKPLYLANMGCNGAREARDRSGSSTGQAGWHIHVITYATVNCKDQNPNHHKQN